MIDCGPYGYHARLELCLAMNVCTAKFKTGLSDQSIPNVNEVRAACEAIGKKWQELQEITKKEKETSDLELLRRMAK